jgi:hypothetical protein
LEIASASSCKAIVDQFAGAQRTYLAANRALNWVARKDAVGQLETHCGVLEFPREFLVACGR